MHDFEGNLGKIARGLFWRFSKSLERKWGWVEYCQNGSECITICEAMIMLVSGSFYAIQIYRQFMADIYDFFFFFAFRLIFSTISNLIKANWDYHWTICRAFLSIAFVNLKRKLILYDARWNVVCQLLKLDPVGNSE